MDLYYLMDGGKLISYEKHASSFLKTHHRRLFPRWAAYVTGSILVLMTELGVQIVDGISILTPEGKGVSSSAAIEVATMSAMAASLGLDTAL